MAMDASQFYSVMRSLLTFSSLGKAIALLFAVWLFVDFREWLSLGTGDMTPDAAGYLKMTKIRIRLYLHGRSDPYDAFRIPLDDSPSYLGDVPKRAGGRPRFIPRPLPERQRPEPCDPKENERLRRLLLTLSQRYPDALRLDLSRLGGRTTDALIVRPEHLQPAAKPSVEQLQGELVHIHETERSMHILLSPGDARAVIGAKWGQFCVLDSMPRNLVRVPVGLEGSRAEVEQIWVYAPRTREEVELIERMCEASVRWAATTQVEADKQKRKK